jgi:chorismate mutase
MANQHPKLGKLRSKIDRSDRELLKALGTRMKVVLEIARYKRENDLPLIQKGRWKQLMRDRIQISDDLDLNKRFTKDLFDLIHREALRLQRKRKST